MPIYGQRPQDVVQDNRGNALRGLLVQLYASESDARAEQSLLGTAVTDEAGRWSFTYEGTNLWARLPNGSVWQVDIDGAVGATVHSALEGLQNDDHPQYHNDARGDARYYTKPEIDASLAAIPGATWGTLAGKPDTFPPDPHTHAASSLPFEPSGSLTATDVQAAIVQAAAITGTPPTYDVKNVYYVSGAYEALPASPDPAWRLVVFHGPTTPTPPSGGDWDDVLFDWQVRS